MAYLTDRKRAAGLGAAHSGTHHHWAMTRSAVALAVLMPLFVLTWGPLLGAPLDQVQAAYARPVPALIAILTLFVGFRHFRGGVLAVIEDYVHGPWNKPLILLTGGLSYTLAAAGILAVLKLAL